MKLVSLLVTAPLASAFLAPAAPSSLTRGRSVRMATLFGYEEGGRPVGGVQWFPDSPEVWDPAGFTKGADDARLWKLANSEIKHGRVAMLACVDYVVRDLGYHFQWADVYPKANGLASVFELPVVGFWVPLIALCGFLDVVTDGNGSDPGFKGNPARVPGNVQPEIDIFPAPGDEDMRTREINNGRMAMVSILGMFTTELLTGSHHILEAFKPFAPAWN